MSNIPAGFGGGGGGLGDFSGSGASNVRKLNTENLSRFTLGNPTVVEL